jgi:predicted amidohydrolase YtcJ
MTLEVNSEPYMYPHRIISAGTVVTMTETPAEAVACLGERIVAVGGRKELAQDFPGAERIHLGDDAVIVPGFNDAHMHPSAVAEDALHLDLSPHRVASRSELADALRARAARTPAGQWIRSYRYDHGKTTGGEIIDRAFLDDVCPEHPAFVVHIACHWGVGNSKALERGGLTDASTDPPGGSLGRDAAGHLTGIVYEQAMFDFAYAATARGHTIIPESSLEDRLASLRSIFDGFHAAGLTSVGDALAYPGAVTLFQEAERRGHLTGRVAMLIAYPHFATMRDAGVRHGFGSTRLRFNGVKAFVDGAVGGGTCLLEEPYEGRPHDHGQQVVADAELDEVVRSVHASGTRIAVHANGDRAITLLLNSMERAQELAPQPHLRHRIEHCTLVTDDILKRMSALGAIAVPFGSYVAFHGDKLEGWYGSERLERMFAHRSFLDAGVAVAGSSDYTCAPFEPLLGLQSCVTRETADGRVLGATQRISAYEALWLYTVGSAQATGESREKGRLAPGYLADFVALGADPLRVEPRSIASIPVLSTWVGGEEVWSVAS